MVQLFWGHFIHFRNKHRHSNRLNISWNDDGVEVKMLVFYFTL